MVAGPGDRGDGAACDGADASAANVAPVEGVGADAGDAPGAAGAPLVGGSLSCACAELWEHVPVSGVTVSGAPPVSPTRTEHSPAGGVWPVPTRAPKRCEKQLIFPLTP